MPNKTKLPALALAAAAALVSVAPLRADETVILQATFSDQDVGCKPNAEIGRCAIWEGSPGGPRLGSVEIVAVEGGDSSTKKAAGFIEAPENGAPPGNSPSMTLDAPIFGEKLLYPADLYPEGLFRIKFLVPAEAAAKGTMIWIGGQWDNGALTVHLENGSAKFVDRRAGSHAAVSTLGDYESGKWIELKVIFHFAKKTCDIWWNGDVAAEDVPWQNPDPKDPRAAIYADSKDNVPFNGLVLCVAEAEIKVMEAAPAAKK